MSDKVKVIIVLVVAAFLFLVPFGDASLEGVWVADTGYIFEFRGDRVVIQELDGPVHSTDFRVEKNFLTVGNEHQGLYVTRFEKYREDGKQYMTMWTQAGDEMRFRMVSK